MRERRGTFGDGACEELIPLGARSPNACGCEGSETKPEPRGASEGRRGLAGEAG